MGILLTVTNENGARGEEKPVVAIKNGKGITLEAKFFVKAPIVGGLKLLVEYADFTGHANFTETYN